MVSVLHKSHSFLDHSEAHDVLCKNSKGLSLSGRCIVVSAEFEEFDRFPPKANKWGVALTICQWWVFGAGCAELVPKRWGHTCQCVGVGAGQSVRANICLSASVDQNLDHWSHWQSGMMNAATTKIIVC